MIRKNIILTAVSVILVIGLAIGIVFEIQHLNSSNNGKRDQKELSNRNNAAVSLCKKTNDEKLCHQILDPVNSTHPMDYIKAAVKATMDQVIKSLNMSEKLILQTSHSPRTKMAIGDCKELLQSAKHELQATLLSTNVDRDDLQNVQDSSYLFKVWLSAVISYQQSCLDGFWEDDKIDQKFLEDMKSGGLLDVGKLTSMSLAIVHEVSDSLQSLGFGIDTKRGSRHLQGIATDDYPTWFSASGRCLQVTGNGGMANAVVAKDGSGQFTTINDALAAISPNNVNRYVIYVKAGIYDENIIIKNPSVTMYGDGPGRTIVTGSRSNHKGWSTLKSASFSVVANGFIAKDMEFQNAAGPHQGQAVALRVEGDMSAFFNCRMDGYQDTLWVQANRQFYRDCVISGTIDFIFGDSYAVIQNSQIIVKRPVNGQVNLITAQGRSDRLEPTAIVIHSCEIIADQSLINDQLQFKSYLGRPWKPLATTVVMESELGGFLDPQAWSSWNETTPPSDLLFYAEYANTGPGAGVNGRVNWTGFHVIDKATALRFTPGLYLEASGIWLKVEGYWFSSPVRIALNEFTYYYVSATLGKIFLLLQV